MLISTRKTLITGILKGIFRWNRRCLVSEWSIKGKLSHCWVWIWRVPGSFKRISPKSSKVISLEIPLRRAAGIPHSVKSRRTREADFWNYEKYKGRLIIPEGRQQHGWKFTFRFIKEISEKKRPSISHFDEGTSSVIEIIPRSCNNLSFNPKAISYTEMVKRGIPKEFANSRWEEPQSEMEKFTENSFQRTSQHHQNTTQGAFHFRRDNNRVQFETQGK